MTWIDDGYGHPRAVQVPTIIARVLQEGPPAAPRTDLNNNWSDRFNALLTDPEAQL